jgi:NADH-ubiquinone oxidoreductase chain 5
MSNQLPVATSCVSLANMALCGLPFMAGFYSKDAILESAINIPNNAPLVLLSVISVGFTSFYSLRFRVVVIWGPSQGSPMLSIKEDIKIIVPILIISLCAISVGAIITISPPVTTSIFMLPTYIKLIPLTILMLGLVIA